MRSATMLFTSCRRSVSRSQPFVLGKRFTSSNGAQKQAVSHGQLYSDLLPGMIPVALLGSAVYLGLKLAQTSLAHEKYLDEAHAKVSALEAELETLRTQLSSQTTIAVPENAGPVLHTEPSTTKRWWFF